MTPNTLGTQYLENSWRCHSATIANTIDSLLCRAYGRLS